MLFDSVACCQVRDMFAKMAAAMVNSKVQHVGQWYQLIGLQAASAHPVTVFAFTV